MKKIIGSVLLLLCSTFLFAAESLTLEDIVSIPDVKNVRLAPNGQHIAYLTRVNTKTHQGVLVKMYNTKTNEFKKLAYSSNDKYVITSIFWGNNDTLLMKAKFPKKENGLLYYESRLLKVNINTGALERVLKRNVFKRMLYFPNVLNKVVDTLPDDDDYILMSLGGYINTLGDAVLRIPITDKGKYKTIQNAKTDIIRWITDAKHNVRIGIHREETTYTIKEKLSNGKFKDLWSYEAFSPETIRPLGFGADNNTLYVKALYKGKNAIYKVDLTDPDLKKELVYNRKNYDVSGRLRRSKETNEIVGIGNYYWDKDYKSLMDSIDAILTETNNTILDVSKDGNKYILLSRNDNQPGMYYVGDKKKRTLQVFAYRHQKLAPDLLSKKTKVKYKARDGLEIEGFITIPRGLKDKNLPTIIFPHGGPISYDNGSYDYWTQFFANKGYAVFQMNFRGSSGYGYDFMKQGIASWG